VPLGEFLDEILVLNRVRKESVADLFTAAEHADFELQGLPLYFYD